MILEVLTHENNPMLLTPTQFFDFKEPALDIKETYINLVETMRERKGLGLAANQVQIPYSIFVMEAVVPVMFINPKIISKSEELDLLEEGCLSYPKLYVPIKRHKSVEVRYLDVNGDLIFETYTGLAARVIQHEMDHLEGKPFFHSASRYHREKAFKNQKKAP